MNEFDARDAESFEQRFFALLTRIYRHLHLYADHNMPADALSPPQLWFLRKLHNAGSPQPIGFFADGVVSSRSNASQMIDRLEGEGLVARTLNPHDRRSVLVELTASGARRMREAQDCMETMAQALFAPLSARERETILAAFERILTLFEGDEVDKEACAEESTTDSMI